MATYHLYYLRQGMLVGSDDIEAPDDGEACRIAAECCDGRTVEVWNDYSRIRVLAAEPTLAA